MTPALPDNEREKSQSVFSAPARAPFSDGATPLGSQDCVYPPSPLARPLPEQQPKEDVPVYDTPDPSPLGDLTCSSTEDLQAAAAKSRMHPSSCLIARFFALCSVVFPPFPSLHGTFFIF